MRRRSGILVAPERRMSSLVMTKTADAVRESFCFVFDTEVTSTFIKSSRLLLLRSCGVSWGHAGVVIKIAIAETRKPRTAALQIPKMTDAGSERFVLRINPSPISMDLLPRL